MDAFDEGFGAGGFHGIEPVGQHGAEDVDHLTIAVRHPAEPALHTSHRGRQIPFLEGGTVTERAGLAGEHGDVMQGVVDRLVASEGPRVAADDLAILPELHALGVGADLDRPTDGPGFHRVAVLVEADETGLRHRGRHGVEAVERPDVVNQHRTVTPDWSAPLGLDR